MLHLLENTRNRFPKTFDVRLVNGFERLIANASKQFITHRTDSHLLLLLIVQFFLQCKIELAIEQNKPSCFVRLFRKKNLCLMVMLPTWESEYVMGKGSLLKAIQQLVPSIHEVEGSCFRWFHPELPYMCLYLEVQKLRGKELSAKEVLWLRHAFKEQLVHFIPNYTPALFWPFNEEEAYKQILVLQKELHHPDDLPQATISFREQLPLKLEFLVNLVRPQSTISIDQVAKKLPSSVSFFHHFFQKIEYPFPLEAWCFSITIPSQPFYENNAINLLYARRHIAKYIELLVGLFRDYNGGLLEKQREKFNPFKTHLANTITDFHLFAEKVLYALRPIEARLSLSFDEAETLLETFSKIMKEKGNRLLRNSEGVLIVKTTEFAQLLPLINRIKEWKDTVAYAQLSLLGFHYLCVLDRTNAYLSQLEILFRQPDQQPKKDSLLRLTFQAGKPLSINPHYLFGDTRCRALSKLLFEGLTRIDAHGEPQLASAEKLDRSQDGLTYTFKLRSFGWSNGEQVTAFHYVSSWCSILKNPNFSSCSELISVIKNAQRCMENRCSLEQLGVYAHDIETLEIQLEWPDPTFLHKLAQPMFFPTLGLAQEPRWFNGPYLIRNQDTQSILLEANPYYWDYQNLFFQQVKVEWFPDAEHSYSLFQAGEIDWMGDPCCKLTSAMISELLQKGELQQQSVARVLWIYLNTQYPALKSAKIRQALSLAIDRSFIIENIYPCNSPLYQILPLSLSLCPNTIVDNDLEASKLLFEEGLREIKYSRETFPPLVLSYPHMTGRKLLAEYLQETWEKAFDINVHLSASDWNALCHRLETGDFQMGIVGAEALYLDPGELLNRFKSIKTVNFSQWEHVFYREKLNRAKQSNRTHWLCEAEKLLTEALPVIPICNFTALFTHHPQLKGYVFDHAGCIDFRWAHLEE